MNKYINFAIIVVTISIAVGAGFFCKLLFSTASGIDSAAHLVEDNLNDTKENKPTEGFSQVDTDGSTTNLVKASIRLTNISEKHLYICVRGVIKSLSSSEQIFTGITCESNLSPHSTSVVEASYNDFHNRISDMCFDYKLYNKQVALYNQELANWQATVSDYTVKATTNAIYAQALQVLQTKKPILPTKIFSWDGCSFDVINALKK